MHILICGEVGVGKSTLIEKLLQGHTVKHGFITKIERDFPDENGMMYVYMHKPGEKRIYTKENCVGRCGAVKGSSQGYSEVFDKLGAEQLSDIPPKNIVLMDEIGFMERNASHFLDSINTVFNGDYLIVGAIKPKHLPYLDALRQRKDVHLFYLDKDNRNSVLADAQVCFEQCYKDLIKS